MIDAANVGMHDAPDTSGASQAHVPLNSRIDASRIAAAIEFFRQRNVGVAAFIPAYVLRRKGPAPASAGGSGSENVMMQTETQEVLQALVDSRKLATVPPNDNDDLYILEFARGKVRGDEGKEGGREETGVGSCVFEMSVPICCSRSLFLAVPLSRIRVEYAQQYIILVYSFSPPPILPSSLLPS